MRDLDRMMHERARLGLLASLTAHPGGLAFSDLKQLCGLTDGNLSRHFQVLQDAGPVSVQKGYRHDRPLTTGRLTVMRRRRFLEYLPVLERIVRDAAVAEAGDVTARTLKPRKPEIQNPVGHFAWKISMNRNFMSR